MSEEMAEAMKELREFMFNNVYIGSKAKSHEEKAQNMLIQLYLYFKEKPHILPVEYTDMVDIEGEPLERVVCDYIAGMTDRYAINKFYDLFIPSSWKEI